MLSSAPPLLRALCGRFMDSPEEVDIISDVDLYTEIVFSGSFLHGGIRDEFSNQTVKPSALERIEKRLNSGWFKSSHLPSPQAHYSSTPTLRPIHLWEPEDWVGMASKPHGAIWTSSFFPDGTSAWDWVEPKVARGNTRALYEFHFDTDTTNVYTIESLGDYIELVREFPTRTSDGNINVYWKRVAEAFDAVHLTTKGLLYATGVKTTVHRLPSMLIGWETESTAWFREPPNAFVQTAL